MKISTVQQKNHDYIHLFGYCGGGPISVEIARILESKGIKPATLFLLDIPSPYNDKENSDTAEWLTRFFNGAFNLSIDEKSIRKKHFGFDAQYSSIFEMALSEEVVTIADFKPIKDALLAVKYNPCEEDRTIQAQLFFKSIFDFDVPLDSLEGFATVDEVIGY